jgi:hypothetical protein
MFFAMRAALVFPNFFSVAQLSPIESDKSTSRQALPMIFASVTVAVPVGDG